MFLAKALVVSLVLTPWVLFPDSAMQIESERETKIMANDTKYITLTEENFQSQVLESTEPVLVDVWADWCGPCHTIAPLIEQVAIDFEGRAKVGKLDIDENASIGTQYGIRGIPTLLFFKDGQVVDEIVGVVSKQVITEKLGALADEGAITHKFGHNWMFGRCVGEKKS